MLGVSRLSERYQCTVDCKYKRLYRVLIKKQIVVESNSKSLGRLSSEHFTPTDRLVKAYFKAHELNLLIKANFSIHENLERMPRIE